MRVPVLALDVSLRDNALASVWRRYDFDRRFVAPLVQALGQAVILGQYGAGQGWHLARARLDAVAAPLKPTWDGHLVAAFSDMAVFAQPHRTQAERPALSDSPYLWLEDEEVSSLNAASLADVDATLALAGREAGLASLEIYKTVHDQAMARYGFRCALTGQAFAPGDPALHVVALQPLALGGPLHVGNFLPMCEAAAFEFEHGHIAIDAHLGLMAHLDRVDPELLEKLNPLGRLIDPAKPDQRPDAQALAFHRKATFDRWTGIA